MIPPPDPRDDDVGAPAIAETQQGLAPFGAGIETSGDTQPAPRARPSRRVRVPPPTVPDPLPPGEASGPANRIEGRPVLAASGHVFRDAEGASWPRSGARDVAAALTALGGPSVPIDDQERSLAAAQAVAHACDSDERLRAYLEAQLGPSAGIQHFRPSAETILGEYAALGRGAREDDVPEGEVIALRPHWSESIALVAARVLRALGRGSGVLLATDPHCPHLGLTLASAFDAAGYDPLRLAVLHDDGQDVLRALAGAPEVAVEISSPGAFASGLTHRLTSLRDAAERARQDEAKASSEQGPGTDGWFGHGVVDRPAAPLRVRSSRGRDLVVGDVVLPGDSDALRLGTDDLGEAAEQVVEHAFGRSVLGGHADRAAARVFVERHVFSRFTECLLEVLDDADADPWFDPPPWARGGDGQRMSMALASARRLGLDEGATLVHERVARDPGGQSDAGEGGGAALRRPRTRSTPHGLVFTNVEPRMRLGGALRAPGVLALLRGTGPLHG